MLVSKIRLNNYRAAKSLEFKFENRLTIFIGSNGSGKSSILDALSTALSWFVAKLIKKNKNGSLISPNDINVSENHAVLNITVNKNDEMFSWTLAKTRQGKKQLETSNYKELHVLTNEFQEKFTLNEATCNLPIVIYYSTKRVGLDIPLRIKGKHYFNQLTAYDEGMVKGVNFRIFFEWYKEQFDADNAKFREHIENKSKDEYSTNIQLLAVQTALQKYFPQYGKPKVKRSPLRLEIEKDGNVLSFQQFSDGEQALISLIADISMRLAMANPSLKNPLEGKGIIMIDEVELHLHPDWQKEVLDKLMNIFTNCQFIVTTHSPVVLSNIKEASIYKVENDKTGMRICKMRPMYGYRTDDIGENFMGIDNLRPDLVMDEITLFYKSIDNKDFARAGDILGRLRILIPDEPELVTMGMIMKTLNT